tara:strand:- start:9591 stop:10859 length:1269 start_codon:yes stop_codon:yes gene_type:complete
MIRLVILWVLILSNSLWSHGTVRSVSKDQELEGKIIFPNTDGFITLVSDLHTHSVFSDGHVWPNVRVEEALRNGLDILAITEHLEYQPHIAYIPNKDRNASYLEAVEASSTSNLIVLSGSEITRSMPPGHMNAIFLKDSNKLLNLDKRNEKKAQKLIEEGGFGFDLREQDMPMANHYALASIWPVEEAVLEANNQGAFVFWNHPMWTSQASDGVARLSDLHKEFIKKNQLHGIEIVNEDTFSEEALEIGLNNNLTLIGTSDVHNLIEWDYQTRKGEHRPVTLIFAKERTKPAIRDALFNGRTVVWFKDILIGKEKNLVPLLESMISIESLGYREGTQMDVNQETSILTVSIRNKSSAELKIQNQSAFSFIKHTNLIVLPSEGEMELQVKTLKQLEDIKLDFLVLNALIEPDKNPIINFKINI